MLLSTCPICLSSLKQCYYVLNTTEMLLGLVHLKSPILLNICNFNPYRYVFKYMSKHFTSTIHKIKHEVCGVLPYFCTT